MIDTRGHQPNKQTQKDSLACVCAALNESGGGCVGRRRGVVGGGQQSDEGWYERNAWYTCMKMSGQRPRVLFNAYVPESRWAERSKKNCRADLAGQKEKSPETYWETL